WSFSGLRAEDSRRDPASGGRVTGTSEFRVEESFARLLDERDPLARFRARFHIPRGRQGAAQLYFAGNSLGLQPTSVQSHIQDALGDWAKKGVAGHFEGTTPWV